MKPALKRWHAPIVLCAYLACASPRTPLPGVGLDPDGMSGPAWSDSDLERAAQQRLAGSTPGTQAVTAHVEHGVVTLSGKVGDLGTKELAVQTVEEITGVEAVTDDLQVIPPARSDDAVRADIEYAFERDPSTRGWAVGVSVSNGVVTLRGIVDSWSEQQLFVRAAEAVSGALKIVDQITIRAAAPPDADIVKQVTKRIRHDAWLDAFPIDVSAKDGIVYLKGPVASLALRRRAFKDAWVQGTQNVDVSGLSIARRRSYERRSAKSEHRMAVPTDAEIVEAVRDALDADPRMRKFMPKATVRQGVVRLEGVLESVRARADAERDAKDIVGVIRVEDDTQVVPSTEPIRDEDIRRGIEKVFASDPYSIDRDQIQVVVSNGTVVLSGVVRSNLARLLVEGDVSTVPGVLRMDDRIAVQKTAVQLKADIEERLAQDPLIGVGDVKVQAGDDGTVTLTGTVETWGELAAAAADAAAVSGNARVINLLRKEAGG